MGAPEYITNGTRIGEDGAGVITWDEACDVSKTGWVKTNKAIVSVDCQSGTHTPPDDSFQLRWRNLTDSPAGAFNTLITGSGELRAGTSAGAISNTDPVGDPQNCPADTIDASEEVENETPLQSASLVASQNDQIETQWCVDMSNALDGKEYQFALWNVDDNESCGTCVPTITTFMAGAIDTLLSIVWNSVDAFMEIEDTNIGEVMGINSGE